MSRPATNSIVKRLRDVNEDISYFERRRAGTRIMDGLYELRDAALRDLSAELAKARIR